MTSHATNIPVTGPRLSNTGRVKTEIGRTGLMDGREFRAFYEFSIAAAAQATIRFVSAVPFILLEQVLAVDAGGIKFSPTVGPTPSGTYNNVIAPVGVNRHIDRPAPYYESQITLTSGGDITGGTVVEVIRAVAANGGQASSVGASIASERALPAGTYYLKLLSIDAGTSTGVYSLRWEERPTTE